MVQLSFENHGTNKIFAKFHGPHSLVVFFWRLHASSSLNFFQGQESHKQPIGVFSFASLNDI